MLGVSWDGTGYGSDGTIWGGEFIIPDGKDFLRAAYIKPFRLPGGEQAIRDVWRIGFALLYDVFGTEVFRLTNIEFIHRIRQVLFIKQMLDKNINSPVTSSMGRLFDGVSAILGIRSTASFEAQAAMELEFAAAEINTNDHFNFRISQDHAESYVIDWHVILRDMVGELDKGVHSDVLAAKFHNTLSESIVETAKLIGINKIVLTGGCFQNKYLLEKSIQRLREEKFKVYWHQRVPTNDGGISLGQIKYSSF